MKHGSNDAFELCYRDLSPLIYTAILRICLNRDTADELLHDTFIRIFENIATFDDNQEFVSWAKRIAFNLTFNYLKKASNKQHDDIDQVKMFSASQAVEIEHYNENLLGVLFKDISDTERLVLWLYIVEQYTHEEISIIVEKSISYSKMTLSRSIKKIKQHEEVARHAI